ncbi:hypothetical protein [Amycolatopsis sp. H20-H5]|uniref:hypothetical protein n=1 Tax=Amycolatopsis sp. H20-H5 TaxID=3046309 RepID=UPI002DB68AB9|nr:hypothetical protein [Amycolatopsis sp. H20-H5]MEC3978184.1 hypothetical protein [Amycolatopsis sp. H20-H5]
MNDDQGGAESAVEQQGYGDQLRARAAWAKALAETQREVADEFAALGEHGFDTAQMSEQAARAAQGLDQIGSLHAEAALAHDDMMAAGGPEDSRAYVEYEATLRRHRTLWPGEDSFGS